MLPTIFHTLHMTLFTVSFPHLCTLCVYYPYVCIITTTSCCIYGVCNKVSNPSIIFCLISSVSEKINIVPACNLRPDHVHVHRDNSRYKMSCHRLTRQKANRYKMSFVYTISSCSSMQAQLSQPLYNQPSCILFQKPPPAPQNRPSPCSQTTDDWWTTSPQSVAGTLYRRPYAPGDVGRPVPDMQQVSL